MLTHLMGLLLRAFLAIPKALGSNWLGLVSPIIMTLIGEFIGGWWFGWNAMKENWKKEIGVGIFAVGVFYFVVFLGCIFATTYSDHMHLVAKNNELRVRIMNAQDHEETSLRLVKDDFIGRLSTLRESCAKVEGANGILIKQTADQQNTINNCQT